MPERNGLLSSGLTAALLLIGIALSAPFLTSHTPIEQIDPVGGRYLPPGSHAWELKLKDGRRWLATSVEIEPADAVVIERNGRSVRLDAAQVTNLGPGGVEDRHFFPLGTDRLGRDCWSRILYGGRLSLLVGLTAAFLSAVIGLLVGTTAGAAGGWIDGLLMRMTDAFRAFPRLFLVLILAAVFEAGVAVVVIVLAVTGWMRVSRLVRAEVLKLKQQEFVLAARAAGSGPVAVAWNHLIRNAMTPVLSSTALLVARVILVEAALSFLGMGIRAPRPTWGNMIYDGSSDLVAAWWASTFPGLAIIATVITFNLIGDGLRDRWHPRR